MATASASPDSWPRYPKLSPNVVPRGSGPDGCGTSMPSPTHRLSHTFMLVDRCALSNWAARVPFRDLGGHSYGFVTLRAQIDARGVVARVRLIRRLRRTARDAAKHPHARAGR